MRQKNFQNEFYLGYLTANDDPSFFKDYLNVKNMVRYKPGVSPLHVCITVSAVRKITDKDKSKIKRLKKTLLKANHISTVKIIFKNNIGRDFSSAQISLKYFSEFCKDESYILIRNRSGYGPLNNKWYANYISQNKKLPKGGLTGSTINQCKIQNVETENQQIQIQTHVQTYAYLSKWKYYKPIADEFPGADYLHKRDVIIQGELGLSSSFIERGLALNCIQWSDHIFTADKLYYDELPSKDVKNISTNVPIRFRYRRYIYRTLSIIDGIIWDPKELLNLIFLKKLKHKFK